MDIFCLFNELILYILLRSLQLFNFPRHRPVLLGISKVDFLRINENFPFNYLFHLRPILILTPWPYQFLLLIFYFYVLKFKVLLCFKDNMSVIRESIVLIPLRRSIARFGRLGKVVVLTRIVCFEVLSLIVVAVSPFVVIQLQRRLL